MTRKRINNTVNEELYFALQRLALDLSQKEKRKVNINDLLDEGIQLVLEKYEKKRNS